MTEQVYCLGDLIVVVLGFVAMTAVICYGLWGAS